MMDPNSGPTHGEDFGHGQSIFFHPSVDRATASLGKFQAPRPQPNDNQGLNAQGPSPQRPPAPSLNSQPALPPKNNQGIPAPATRPYNKQAQANLNSQR